MDGMGQRRADSDWIETPSDLLSELEQEFEGRYKYPDPRVDALASIRDRVDVSDAEFQEIAKDLEESPGQWVHHLLEELAEPMNPEFRSFLLDEDRVLAAELNTGEIEGATLRAANGGWLIVVSRGLMYFVYNVVRALCVHLRYDGQPAVSGANRAGDLIGPNLDWFVTTGVPLGVEFEIDPIQLKAAVRLATSAERFVIAHEIGHQIQGHVDEGTHSAILGNREVEVINLSKHQEHEADVAGASLIVEGSRYGETFDPLFAYAGIELFFHSLDLWEGTLGYPESDTHPAAAERLSVVRDALEANVTPDEFKAVTNLADCFADVLEPERERILSAERRADALNRQEEFDLFLDKLLRRFSNGDSSSVQGFYQEFCAHQMDFHPEVICRGLGTQLNEGLALGFSRGTGDQPFDPDARMVLLLDFLGSHTLLRYAIGDWVEPELAEAIASSDTELERDGLSLGATADE
jgi:hypothetical protein